MERRFSSTANDFSVGLVQMTCTSNQDKNREFAVEGVRSAVKNGAKIVCLQELFASQYFCQTEDVRCFDLAESIPGPSTELFSALAKELAVVIVVPIFEKRTAGLYHNSAAVIDSTGALVGVYRKLHIPDDPQYFEKFYFTPGELGYGVFDTTIARIGILICWDQWYPEAARLTALQGAEIIFYPSAIGWLPTEDKEDGLVQVDAWRTIQQSHAIANGVYIATVNRVGQEGKPGLSFWGRSFVCDPRGQIIVEASETKGEVLVAHCSRVILEEQRRAWPFLRDRRIDTYAPITKRFLDHSLES